MKLTNSEQQVMDIFWNEDTPLSQGELLALSDESKTWKDRSVYILLNGLLTKGILKEDGFVRSGKGFARRFSPTMSYEEYLAQAIYCNRMRPDIVRLVAVLLEQEEVTPQALQEMEQIVQKKRRNAP